MRLTSSTHNHTNLCDGRNTPDEMARAALEAGFTDFGFSGHSYAPFDLDYSVKSEQHYVQELRALQKAYAGRLRIAVGMEADWFAPVNDRAALDYIIGSVHYLRDEATGRYYAVDGAPEALDACVTQMFGGDALAMARAYYALVTENVRKYRPEIIGHFDLVKKNNCGGHLFDEADPVYRTAALEVLDACAYYHQKTGRRMTFEYSLVGGVNDHPEDARRLAALAKPIHSHINLIPVNPVTERSFVQPKKEVIGNFKKELEKYGINVTIRREMGRDIDGACGQLRRRYLKSGEPGEEESDA